MSKIDQIYEQINFLIELQEDSLQECLQEFGSLMTYLEKYASENASDESAYQTVEEVRSALSENYEKMVSEYKDDLAFLKEQKRVVDQAYKISDPVKKTEIIKMIMDDAGEVSETKEFIKKVEIENKAARNEFLQMITEIREAVQEGAIEELLELFQASKIEDSSFQEEEAEEKEEEEDIFKDVSSQDITKFLKEISKPYSAEEEGDQEEKKKTSTKKNKK